MNNEGKTIINQPSGEHFLSPIKMVMTGGWFTVVLPTLGYIR